jgi:hypothetical protein
MMSAIPGMSSSARISGWLGTVMVTCGILPSLTLGSRGSDTTPFLLAVTTLAVTFRSLHRTFPWPGAFGLQHLAVRISDHRYEGRLLSRHDPWAFGQPGLHRFDRNRLQVNLRPQATCRRVHPLSTSRAIASRHAPGSRIVWIDAKLKGWKSRPCDSPLPLLARCLEKSNTEPTGTLRVHARFCEDCGRDSTTLRIGREELHGGVTCTAPSCRPSQSVPR